MIGLKMPLRSARRHPLRTFSRSSPLPSQSSRSGSCAPSWMPGMRGRGIFSRAGWWCETPSRCSFLPYAYREKIQQISGVTEVSHGNWFGGIYVDERTSSEFRRRGPHVSRPLPGVHPARSAEGRVPPGAKGLCGSRKTAERFGWRVGSVITLKGTVFPELGAGDSGHLRGKDRSTDETLLSPLGYLTRRSDARPWAGPIRSGSIWWGEEPRHRCRGRQGLIAGSRIPGRKRLTERTGEALR